MTVTPRLKISWSVVNLLVLLYALVPVLWIASLSFKPAGTIKDGKFIPEKWTLDNYRGIFDTSAFTSALINSIGIALITTLIAVSPPASTNLRGKMSASRAIGMPTST